MKKWETCIGRIVSILEPKEDKTSESVENELAHYLKQIQATLNTDEDFSFVDNLLRYSKGFWKGLFSFYDHSFLPRTNNDLELFFKRMKRAHRRITGLRSWNRYIIRHGELIVFTPEAADNDNTLSRITAVSYDHYKAEMYRWKDRISEQ
ncbi:MAG TPA: hypothetical protein VFK14_06605, partial [Solirubrobacterales bacterium]|nr:hypothetical protein [Solirubrobacterales bacterium]